MVDITHDRVLVVPAFGEVGKLPFWHGDNEGRPADLGASIGRATAALAAGTGFELTHSDERARRNLEAYVRDQLTATGAVPTDRQIVVERSRDNVMLIEEYLAREAGGSPLEAGAPPAAGGAL